MTELAGLGVLGGRGPFLLGTVAGAVLLLTPAAAALGAGRGWNAATACAKSVELCLVYRSKVFPGSMTGKHSIALDEPAFGVPGAFLLLPLSFDAASDDTLSVDMADARLVRDSEAGSSGMPSIVGPLDDASSEPGRRFHMLSMQELRSITSTR